MLGVITLEGVPAHAAVCSPADAARGLCVEGSIDGDDAIIRGDGGTGGNNGNNGNDNGGSQDDGGGGGGGVPIDPSRDLQCVSGPMCIAEEITLSDLASFRPVAPTLAMEPDGWMLIGLPANFIVGTQTHVVSGTLFDYPLDVRFTPSSYSWAWGDGTSSRSSVPGASWAALGVPEFSPTPTSHVFETKGVYRISVTVHYSVEFSVDSRPWRTIDGTLPGPAAIVAALAGNAKTVLVERECTKNPEGPGC